MRNKNIELYYETPSGDSKVIESIDIGKLEIQQDYPQAVFGDREPNGEGWERILVWADEASAANDDGANAIGQFVIRAQ